MRQPTILLLGCAPAATHGDRAYGGRSALHLAKTEAVVEMLLKHGIDKALTSVAGQTAAQQCLGGGAVQQFIGTAKVERATRHERWGVDSPAPAPAPSTGAFPYNP